MPDDPGLDRGLGPGRLDRGVVERASRIPLGQPHELVNTRRDATLGGTADAFEAPAVTVA